MECTVESVARELARIGRDHGRILPLLEDSVIQLHIMPTIGIRVRSFPRLPTRSMTMKREYKSPKVLQASTQEPLREGEG